jgi:hypothetical protein
MRPSKFAYLLSNSLKILVPIAPYQSRIGILSRYFWPRRPSHKFDFRHMPPRIRSLHHLELLENMLYVNVHACAREVDIVRPTKEYRHIRGTHILASELAY